MSTWPFGAKSLTYTPSAYNLTDAGFAKSAQIITSRPVSFRFYPNEFPCDLGAIGRCLQESLLRALSLRNAIMLFAILELIGLRLLRWRTGT